MIKLDGIWKFRLDPKGKGVEEHWEKESFEDTIKIPGILQEQGYGEAVTYQTEWVEGLSDPLWYLREENQYAQEDKVRIPFLSQPPKTYRGKAWYQIWIHPKQIEDGRWYSFFIENTRWRSHVWLDEKYLGEELSLCTPHEFQLGFLIKKEYRLTLCLDNSMQLPYRPDGHGVSDALGAGWNGMAGKIELHSHPALSIKQVRVFSDIQEKKAVFEIILWNHAKEEIPADLWLEGEEESSVLVECKEGIQKVTVTKRYHENTKLWDEFSTNILSESVIVKSTYGTVKKAVTFGLSDVRTEDGLFKINHRTTYFRGTHFGGDYPLSGYPNCKLTFWQDIMKKLKEWGLNFIRFHSYCPPEAAFEAADLSGIYLLVECGMWNCFQEGDFMVEAAKQEAERILYYFGNHPSFVMLSPTNEPKGNWIEPLKEFVLYCKELDSRKLYTIQSGWPYPMEPSKISGTDFVYFHRSGYGLEPGGTIRNSPGWKGKDYRESLNGVTYPVICHELGQWCSYPDFSVIEKFTGYLAPGNFEIFRESAKKHGVFEYAKDFQYHSGKLQSLMYKEEIEANLRTPHMYGFELLDLHDYLGQGTALVGVLDAFWEEKGYIKAKDWRRFCSATVPLARISKYIYEQGELCCFPVEVSHFGEKAFYHAKITYGLVERKEGVETTIINGEIGTVDIPIGKNIKIGTGSFAMPPNPNPAVYELWVQIETQEGQTYENSWKLWSYCRQEKITYGKDICHTKDWEEAKLFLMQGKKVLFTPNVDSLSYDCPKLKFKPVFWNAQMGPTWARNMGIICDRKHPVFERFPTDSYADWQWEDILEGTRGINLSHFQDKSEPIVRVIDDWNRNYPLALILEANVLKGRLLMTTIDFGAEDEKRLPVQALLNSILHYMKGSRFNPGMILSVKEWMSVHHENHVMELLEARAVLEETKQDVSIICNGNPEDYFLYQGYPAHIKITMSKAHIFYGIVYVPRQNNKEHEGDIKNYRIEYEKDEKWEFLCEGELKSSFLTKEILFPHKVTASKIRFIALSGFKGEHVTKWQLTEKGWYCKVGNYEDSHVSIACLTLLCDEELGTWRGITKYKGAEAKSATIDIDN